MSGNKDKLEDFEHFDGGKVTFGGSTGTISGKSTIKTKTLNFENVLYVKELQHFNLISVSQICDQTHRVLFTENECLVLSKDFPLPDPSMVILSIPRKHNLRLGHVNFKNMNKLVKGNLVREVLKTQIIQRKSTRLSKPCMDYIRLLELDNSKLSSTPFEPQKIREMNVLDEHTSVHLYRSMIRCLMYLTATRPDIMFAVCAAARHQVTPKTSNLLSVKRIFKYLTAYPKLGLWYLRDSPFDLKAFSDSDYAGANGDRKSTTGGCQFLGRRDANEKKLIQVLKIPTEHNVADLLTKSFDVTRFDYLVVNIDLLKVCRALTMSTRVLNCLAFKLEEIVMALMTCLKLSGVYYQCFTVKCGLLCCDDLLKVIRTKPREFKDVHGASSSTFTINMLLLLLLAALLLILTLLIWRSITGNWTISKLQSSLGDDC
nr:uncharacterized mitochondrial protein AtMg00810-like [Tanacetum cinerariifolium]